MARLTTIACHPSGTGAHPDAAGWAPPAAPALCPTVRIRTPCSGDPGDPAALHRAGGERAAFAPVPRPDAHVTDLGRVTPVYVGGWPWPLGRGGSYGQGQSPGLR